MSVEGSIHSESSLTATISSGGEQHEGELRGYANVESSLTPSSPEIVLNSMAPTSNLYNLVHRWDFTQSLVDDVNGVEAVLQSKYDAPLPTMSEEGLLFSEASQECYLIGGFDVRRKRIEMDISSYSRSNTAAHVSILMCGKTGIANELNSGLLGRLGSYNISFWNTWWDESTRPLADIDGKLLAIETDSYGFPILYLNDEEIFRSRYRFGNSTKGNESLRIGSMRKASNGGNFYTALIKGLRIYSISKVESLKGTINVHNG